MSRETAAGRAERMRRAKQAQVDLARSAVARSQIVADERRRALCQAWEAELAPCMAAVTALDRRGTPRNEILVPAPGSWRYCRLHFQAEADALAFASVVRQGPRARWIAFAVEAERLLAAGRASLRSIQPGEMPNMRRHADGRVTSVAPHDDDWPGLCAAQTAFNTRRERGFAVRRGDRSKP